MIKTVTDSDMIILQSVESYLKSMGAPITNNPQERLKVMEQHRDWLYSDIVRRVPHVAAYIMAADMENDNVAQGLYFALSQHVMDPIFVELLMRYLNQNRVPSESSVTGALLTKILNKYLSEHMPAPKSKPPVPSKSKKGEKDATEASTDKKPDLSEIQHIRIAIGVIFEDIVRKIEVRYPELTETQKLGIAASLGTNNEDTIDQLVASQLPITASIFDLVEDPSEIIKAAVNLPANAYTQTTDNQKKFLDSLRDWVYKKLNEINTQTCYQWLVAAYGKINPDMNAYYIHLKDCGNNYSNLKAVAQQLFR